MTAVLTAYGPYLFAVLATLAHYYATKPASPAPAPSAPPAPSPAPIGGPFLQSHPLLQTVAQGLNQALQALSSMGASLPPVQSGTTSTSTSQVALDPNAMIAQLTALLGQVSGHLATANQLLANTSPAPVQMPLAVTTQPPTKVSVVS